MKLELDKEEQKTLIRCIEMAGAVYGIMGDLVDEKYREQSRRIEALGHLVLAAADKDVTAGITERFEGKPVVTDDYLDSLHEDFGDFEEHAFWDFLVRHLAKQELARTLGKEGSKGLGEDELRERLYALEDKYWHWAEEVGLDGLEARGV